ncbi:metal ABC transporter ATP-binding protein [Kozakia baliensis]|uniref:metal ABC transporter ATP-binding protein n=1 Tax=Kozakia baliensis TaxID=153496 RepID=UPI00068B7CCE|nr:ATP-binding cassette domain-containing protein [Kozakia baliensis]
MNAADNAPLPALALQNAALLQGSRILFDQANVSLPTGSLTLLLGANGTGKTTFLRALLGLHTQTRGAWRIFGQTLFHSRNLVGYLPQERRIPAPQIEGRAFIAAAWRGNRWGLPNFGSALRQEVDRVLTLTDALHLARQPLGQLSGGEKQRLFMAEALVGRPRLLLLDEPLAGMDHARQAETASLLTRLRHELGLTILLSTHELSALEPYADHILRLSHDRLTLHHAAI